MTRNAKRTIRFLEDFYEGEATFGGGPLIFTMHAPDKVAWEIHRDKQQVDYELKVWAGQWRADYYLTDRKWESIKAWIVARLDDIAALAPATEGP